MGSQGDFFIGEIVKDEAEAIKLLQELGAKEVKLGKRDPSPLPHEQFRLKYELTFRGKTYKGLVEFHDDGEGNLPGVLGIQLTTRYGPAIIDVGMEYGKDSPFILNLPELADLLKQVRKWWKKAELIEMDIWY